MKRITNFLRYAYFHHHDADVSTYQKFFNAIFTAAGLQVRSDSHTSIVVETDKAYSIFEFAMNDEATADEALAHTDQHKVTLFHRVRDVFCVGVNFRYDDAAAPHQFVCNWIADLYSESGLLRQSLSGEEMAYLHRQQVNIKREPVRDTYTIMEELGNGSFATVRKCIEKKTGKTFAAKFISVSRNDEKRRDYVREEIDVMNRLHHPKLISLHDAFENEDQIVLIVEL
jgi:hypothetical protein